MAPRPEILARWDGQSLKAVGWADRDAISAFPAGTTFALQKWEAGGGRRAHSSACSSRSPRRIFIQSMSDLFDLEVPLEWFAEAWAKILQCDRIDIQIVTKRISVVEKRLAPIGITSWPKHAGLIVTVVNQAEFDRDVPRLRAMQAKFGIPWLGLSCEPLLGPIVGDFSGLDWIIVGGESGKDARHMEDAWAESIQAQCAASDTAFFMKQMGGPAKARMRPIPQHLMVREMPVQCGGPSHG